MHEGGEEIIGRVAAALLQQGREQLVAHADGHERVGVGDAAHVQVGDLTAVGDERLGDTQQTPHHRAGQHGRIVAREVHLALHIEARHELLDEFPRERAHGVLQCGDP